MFVISMYAYQVLYVKYVSKGSCFLNEIIIFAFLFVKVYLEKISLLGLVLHVLFPPFMGRSCRGGLELIGGWPYSVTYGLLTVALLYIKEKDT